MYTPHVHLCKPVRLECCRVQGSRDMSRSHVAVWCSITGHVYHRQTSALSVHMALVRANIASGILFSTRVYISE